MAGFARGGLLMAVGTDRVLQKRGQTITPCSRRVDGQETQSTERLGDDEVDHLRAAPDTLAVEYI